MHVVAQQDLPFVGMSRHFVGADQGRVAMSAYLVEAPPGRRSRPHRHPYDEVVFVREGCGRWSVDGVAREAGPGDIVVVKAGSTHSFLNTGGTRLVTIAVHLNERCVQENLDCLDEAMSPR